MPVEIEAKMKVADLAVVRDRLIAAGAKLIGEFLERNTFFDTEDRSLLAADEGLRLRQNQNLNTGERVCIMTFKGPRQHGQLKSREETETTVGSFADASGLIEKMGFTRVLTFEKRRDSWAINGCEVELDNVPRLGTYVEIEGPRDEMVLKVRELLQLNDRPLVRASYVAMLMTHLQEASETTTQEVLFPPNAATQRVGSMAG